MRPHQISKYTVSLFAASLAAVLAAGCQEGTASDNPGGSAQVDDSVDLCAQFDWYNDGECDTICPQPDPDCQDTADPDPPSGGDADIVEFSNGGVTVQAKTVESGDMKTTSVSEGGQPVLVMETTSRSVKITFPREGGSETVTELSRPLEQMPSDFAVNRLAAFIAGQLYYAPNAQARQDNPGCDMFPDTRCTLRCCADHDRCYGEHDCGASSWLPFIGSEACKNCNALAQMCILEACAYGLEGDPSTDVCHDASCGMDYTCPEDPYNCYACASPCASPESCGNGTCEVGETPENCISDCATGLGINICCRENNGCPSETPTSCPGDCCCCGLGEVCGVGDLCTPTLSAAP